MGKSKVRKNRRTGPHKNLQQLATAKAGRNFARMVCLKADEGSRHTLTIALAQGEVSTPVRVTDKRDVIVENQEVSDFIITSLASLQTAAITLETYGEDDLVYTRSWLVDGGVFQAATAEECRAAAQATADKLEGPAIGANVVFRDAFKLT